MSKNFNASKLNGQAGVANGSTWKHSIDVPSGFDKTKPTIILYKNPYTWVESIAYRNQVDWVKRQTLYPVTEECDDDYKIGPNNFNLINLCKTYQHFHRTWVMNNPCEIRMIIKYEDLLDDKKRSHIMHQIKDEFMFQRSTPAGQTGWFIPPKGKVSQSKDYTPDRESYYISMKPKHLNKKQIDKVNEVIGNQMIKQLGYVIL